MAVEPVADPLDLIQGNFPEDSEEKFAASSAGFADMVAHHTLMASEYRSTISALSDDRFQGLLADKTREELGKLGDSHDAGEQFCQKLSETFGTLGMQILVCKNQINSSCASATAAIAQLEMQKAESTKPSDQKDIQDKIDKATKQARDDIKTLHDQLETSLNDAETSLKTLQEQFEAATNPGGGQAQPDAAMGARPTPVPDESLASRSGVAGSDALGSDSGVGAQGGGSDNLGAQQGSGSGSAMNPAAMMGAMPQQMPQAPSGGGMPGGGGSQLPGQELASKAMDMAQNMNGKDSSYLSDSSVKDLLAAAGEQSGGDSGSGSDSTGGGKGDVNGSSGEHSGSTTAAVGGVSNPTVAGGPSPAAPVSSARPSAGPSVAMTELAGAPASAGPVSGLSSAASGIGGLTTGPATQVVGAAQAINASAGAGAASSGFGAPLAFSPNAGSVAVPSTGAGFGSVSPSSLAPAAVGSGAAPVAQPAPVVPAAPPPAMSPSPVLPVGAPPVAAGIGSMPASVGSVRAGLVDLFIPPAMIAVEAAAPARLEDLPLAQRITVLNTASIVTQMRAAGWPASVATALLDDGVTFTVVIATADDLSIMPADITIPRASILLHGLNLGEQFRSEWAGNADTVSKIVAAVDRHPLLNRSMIKHACAFTRNREIRDPAVPFTPMSMDAAWAIRYLYTAPRETAPAHTVRAELLTEEQIGYLLGVAERRWQLPTIRLSREGQARLESASMFASRWSSTGEAQLTSSPRGYDHRIAGYLWASTREALLEGDLERASWYAQFLRYQTLPTAVGAVA